MLRDTNQSLQKYIVFNKRRQAVKSYMLFENLRDREDW